MCLVFCDPFLQVWFACVLGDHGGWVLEFGECFGDESQHVTVHVTIDVIPGELDATEKCAIPINCSVPQEPF